MKAVLLALAGFGLSVPVYNLVMPETGQTIIVFAAFLYALVHDGR